MRRMTSAAAATRVQLDLAEVHPVRARHEGAIRVEPLFRRASQMVLGGHALASGPYGETLPCAAAPGVVL